MPTRVRDHSKPRRKTYIRQWREHRELSQERLVSRLNEAGIEISVAQYSRIENGVSPYTQDTLEALAHALRTDPASLLMRDPSDPEGIWSIWDQAKPGERQMIVGLAKTVTKTGTGG